MSNLRPMTPKDREIAITYAKFAHGWAPGGPTAEALRLAANGSNEDLLYAIHLILKEQHKALMRTSM